MSFITDIQLDDSEDFQLSRSETVARFGSPVTEEELDQAIKNRVPEKTRRATQWAVSVFKAWSEARQIRGSLEKLSTETLQELFPKFVVETRRQDGTPYPPNTLVQLVAGLQRHLRESGRPEMSILSDKDPKFARTRAALDARMKQLTKEGVGCTRKQAQPLSLQQEEALWEKEIFSLNTGEGLLYAVFWYNCKLFGLRGGDEHRNLVREQYEIEYDTSHRRFLRFKGRSSKNVQGGLKQRKVEMKDLKVYAQPELGERCIVDIFNLYFGFVPTEGAFYRKPIGNDPPKFSKQVLGKNRLSKLIKEMCDKAGFSGNYTNHSGKVTCTTELFAKNVDEQLIMHQMGHRSNAVHLYKRPTAEHEQMVSAILQPPPIKIRKLEDEKENTSPTTCMEPVPSAMQPSAPYFPMSSLPVPSVPSLPQPSAQSILQPKGLSGGITLNFNFGLN